MAKFTPTLPVYLVLEINESNPRLKRPCTVDFHSEDASDRMVVMFTKKEPKPGIRRPITKKPLPIKPVRKASQKKTIIAKKKTFTRLVTKKKNSKRKVAKKILKKKIG